MLILFICCSWVTVSLCDAEIFYSEGHICRNNTACKRNLPCQLFDNVTCILDPREDCRPRFISAIDDSEVTCGENDRLYCTDEEVALFCPTNTTLKVLTTSFVEMDSNFCLAQNHKLNSRLRRHCTYTTISDDILLRIYETCEGQQNCSFQFQSLLDPVCDGQAFWISGKALVLRMEHQCIEMFARPTPSSLWMPLLWIILSIVFAVATFSAIVCFDWGSWCRHTRRHLSRTHWHVSVPLLLSSDADFV
ncbi:hypothetical protein ECG_04567 [Echinococcus granulosus]|uniref:Expressed conserved protein n=1 Tax=Echinococcus granulosus TaxID=6210 RepID=A0A068WHJ2_ECHGR|nr:hypothetical protein ECG_04567 [Echinococcus granulosus]CDS17144.1 hypothetical protein EgrG_000987900 [Echinococcus granulosus]